MQKNAILGGVAVSGLTPGAIQSGGLPVTDSKHPFTADFSASSTHGVTPWTLTGGLHARHFFAQSIHTCFRPALACLAHQKGQTHNGMNPGFIATTAASDFSASFIIGYILRSK
ncbi:hypothetical protein [Rhodoferax sp.]|uniref:hypothetical protein n=1 Tax=Rhodoferax sp. TaxID=50421 RepID=UPI00272C0396|nr:hypothetical protein [Rhodoferax sp.]